MVDDVVQSSRDINKIILQAGLIDGSDEEKRKVEGEGIAAIIAKFKLADDILGES